MTPFGAVMTGLWLVAIVTSLAIIWTPWRLTRSQLSIDLSDQITGRPVSPLHAFAVPAVLLAGPVVMALAGRGADMWSRPRLLVPMELFLLAAAVLVQWLLRREILKAWRQQQAGRVRAQAVFAAGRRKSVRRP